jgi:hypothetical protein
LPYTLLHFIFCVCECRSAATNAASEEFHYLI